MTYRIKNGSIPLKVLEKDPINTNMQKSAFTLLELLIVIVVIGILAFVAIPRYQGSITRSKMAELYSTVATIHKAEDLYFYEYGEYAANADETAGADLPYSTTQAYIDNFENILGLQIPGMASIFVYGVYYNPANIYVRVRDHFNDWGIICRIYIEGNNKGTWVKYGSHPWSKYLSIP